MECMELRNHLRMLHLFQWMMLLVGLEYRQVELALLLRVLVLGRAVQDSLRLQVLLVKLPYKSSLLSTANTANNYFFFLLDLPSFVFAPCPSFPAPSSSSLPS